MNGIGWKPPTMIYVALRPDGIRKIGSTQNLELRLLELTAEYRKPYRREHTWDIPGGWANCIEQRVHLALKPHRVDVGMGSREHYRVSLDVISEAVAWCGDMSGAQPHPTFIARTPEMVERRLQGRIRRLRSLILAGLMSEDEARSASGARSSQ